MNECTTTLHVHSDYRCPRTLRGEQESVAESRRWTVHEAATLTPLMSTHHSPVTTQAHVQTAEASALMSSASAKLDFTVHAITKARAEHGVTKQSYSTEILDFAAETIVDKDVWQHGVCRQPPFQLQGGDTGHRRARRRRAFRKRQRTR